MTGHRVPNSELDNIKKYLSKGKDQSKENWSYPSQLGKCKFELGPSLCGWLGKSHKKISLWST